MLSRIRVMGMPSKEEATFKVQVRREECKPREVKWWREGKEEMELAQQREVSTVYNTEEEYMPNELK